MSKPTLSVAVTCPTCGGTGEDPGTGSAKYLGETCHPCEGNGTIRQPVSCAGCRFYDHGECLNMCVAAEEWNYYQPVDPNFGCLLWEGPE